LVSAFQPARINAVDPTSGVMHTSRRQSGIMRIEHPGMKR
jgi:hypothetical protein